MPPLVPASMNSILSAASSLAATNGVVEVRVAAVDDDVAGRQHRAERGDRVVDRLAGRHHDPDRRAARRAPSRRRRDPPRAWRRASDTSLTASALRSKTTSLCPWRISRSTMLPPMRPRPIIASCISVLSFQWYEKLPDCGARLGCAKFESRASRVPGIATAPQHGCPWWSPMGGAHDAATRIVYSRLVDVPSPPGHVPIMPTHNDPLSRRRFLAFAAGSPLLAAAGVNRRRPRAPAPRRPARPREGARAAAASGTRAGPDHVAGRSAQRVRLRARRAQEDRRRRTGATCPPAPTTTRPFAPIARATRAGISARAGSSTSARSTRRCKCWASSGRRRS